jgi:CHAT domain-containing protein
MKRKKEPKNLIQILIVFLKSYTSLLWGFINNNHLKGIYRFYKGFFRAFFRCFPKLLKGIRNPISTEFLDFWESANQTEGMPAVMQQKFSPLFLSLRKYSNQNVLPSIYVAQTHKFVSSVMESKTEEDVYLTITKHINQMIDGQYRPLFVPYSVASPSNELLACLNNGKKEKAIEIIERMPSTSVLYLLPGNNIALVHLIPTNLGTYSIVSTKEGVMEMSLNGTLTDKKIEHLLRSWLYLYFSDIKEINSLLVEKLSEHHSIPDMSKGEFNQQVWSELYDKIYNNEIINAKLPLTQIPIINGMPVLPFQLAIIMEIILIELGCGYLDRGQGLWKGIADKLTLLGVDRIIISADKALRSFPHHAAILGEGIDEQKEYLSDRFDISYIPIGSLSKIKVSGHPRYRPQKAFAIGTEGDQFSFASINSLCKMFPHKISNINVTDQSNADVMKKMLNQDRIDNVLFIGHAKYDWEKPLDSSICLLLNDEKKPARLLRFEHLLDMITKSPPEMMVLAACETGVPDTQTDASSFGNLTDMLLERVPLVVSTLWRVQRTATILLINKFYSTMMETDQLEVSAALSSAQKWLRTVKKQDIEPMVREILNYDKYGIIRNEILEFSYQDFEQPFAHPYFWSPFYLSGVV